MVVQGYLHHVVEAIRVGAKKSDELYSGEARARQEKKLEDTTPICVPLPQQGYVVRTFTGNVKWAGTNANVYVCLFDDAGDMVGPTHLSDSNCATREQQELRFQKGKLDIFFLDIPPMQELTKIRVGLGQNGTDHGNGWFLDKVVVQQIDTGKSYSFLCGRWLALDEDDKQVVRDLPLEHPYEVTLQDFSKDVSLKWEVPIGDVMPLEVKSYTPKVFRNIRKFYEIDTDDYVQSWQVAEDKMEAKEGAGRSGSLFLHSSDKKFILKTIPKDEVETLLHVLPNWYEYLVQEHDTLIMKMLGLLRVKGRRTVYVLVFVNVLYNTNPIVATYDLKGRAAKPGKALQNTSKLGTDYVFKDKDLDRTFPLRDDFRIPFFDRIDKDIKFLEFNNLMDYSILIGVSKIPQDEAEEEQENGDQKWVFKCYGEKGTNEVYNIGIIDCLTSYNLKKKMAHVLKSALWTADTLSTVDATAYGERIRKYMMEIFENGSPPISRAKPFNLSAMLVRRHSAAQAGSPMVSHDPRLTELKITTLEHRVARLEECLRAASPVIVQLLEKAKAEGKDVDSSLLTMASLEEPSEMAARMFQSEKIWKTMSDSPTNRNRAEDHPPAQESDGKQ